MGCVGSGGGTAPDDVAVGSDQDTAGGVDFGSGGPVAVGVVGAASLADHLHGDRCADALRDLVGAGAAAVSAHASQ